tara:strand:- start:935 stop:1192 length:258 start_codon:yes stop_codon:yes gene_type:complete
MLEKIAKMQTELRNFQQHKKKQDQVINERDKKIQELESELKSFKDKENLKAKNQSYLELKVQKEVDQINENKKRQMKGKDDKNNK